MIYSSHFLESQCRTRLYSNNQLQDYALALETGSTCKSLNHPVPPSRPETKMDLEAGNPSWSNFVPGREGASQCRTDRLRHLHAGESPILIHHSSRMLSAARNAKRAPQNSLQSNQACAPALLCTRTKRIFVLCVGNRKIKCFSCLFAQLSLMIKELFGCTTTVHCIQSPEVYEGDLVHGCYLEVFGCLNAVRRLEDLECSSKHVLCDTAYCCTKYT